MTYHHFAYIYDQLMAHAPYEKWISFTTNIIHQLEKEVHTIVDLGCGTGSIAVRLAKSGFDVIGVDQSTDMLTAAAERALNDNVSINWIEQDIRKLTGFNQIDLFISYCDVINYVTKKHDLQSVFERVYHSLRTGGIFIFDVHSFAYAQKKLIGQTFADVTDDLAYIWDCEQGNHRGEMYHYLTFFQRENGKYIRFDETHHQRTYEIYVYEQLLNSGGFTKIHFYSDFLFEKTFSEEHSERIFIVAEK